MPKYPPSKEIDAKMREEEARRQGALSRRAQRVDQEKRMQRETCVNPVTDANVGRRQDHTNAKSLNEVFNPNWEGAVSGFVIDPTKQSRVLKDMSKDFSENINKRASLSGPLIRELVSTRSGREHNDLLMVPSKGNLSKLSGLVAARTLSSEDQQEKHGPSRMDAINHVHRVPGSVYEEQCKRNQDQKHHTQRVAYSHPMNDEKACIKEPSLHGCGSRDNKIYVSGPLLVSSNNVDQLLKEHDQRIQEYARRTRHEKARPCNQTKTSTSRHAALGWTCLDKWESKQCSLSII